MDQLNETSQVSLRPARVPRPPRYSVWDPLVLMDRNWDFFSPEVASSKLAWPNKESSEKTLTGYSDASCWWDRTFENTIAHPSNHWKIADIQTSLVTVYTKELCWRLQEKDHRSIITSYLCTTQQWGWRHQMAKASCLRKAQLEFHDVRRPGD